MRILNGILVLSNKKIFSENWRQKKTHLSPAAVYMLLLTAPCADLWVMVSETAVTSLGRYYSGRKRF